MEALKIAFDLHLKVAFATNYNTNIPILSLQLALWSILLICGNLNVSDAFFRPPESRSCYYLEPPLEGDIIQIMLTGGFGEKGDVGRHNAERDEASLH